MGNWNSLFLQCGTVSEAADQMTDSVDPVKSAPYDAQNKWAQIA